MYESMLLIHPDKPIGTATLASELRSFYQGSDQSAIITERGQSGLDLQFKDYIFRLDFDRSPHVLEEAADIAARFGANTGKQQRIAACTSRFEVRADDDPEMNYFNDFMYIIEASQRIGEVYAFDTASRSFL